MNYSSFIIGWGKPEIWTICLSRATQNMFKYANYPGTSLMRYFKPRSRFNKEKFFILTIRLCKMPAGCQKQPDAGFTRPRPSYWTYEFNDKTFAFLAQMWLFHVVTRGVIWPSDQRKYDQWPIGPFGRISRPKWPTFTCTKRVFLMVS